MDNVTLEIIKLIFFNALCLYLWYLSGKQGVRRAAGWPAIFGACLIINIGLIINISASFPYLSKFLILGDSPYQPYVKNLVVFPSAFILFIVGVARLLPAASALEEAQASLKELNKRLEKRVAKRTAEIQLINEKLLTGISEHESASEFLYSVLSSLTHPFYVINAHDYTIMVANRAARSNDVSVGQKCYTATHGGTSPCTGDGHPCPLMEVKKTGRPQVVEHIHYDHEGNPRNVEIHAYPRMSPEGEVLQIIEYALDITDRKRVEEQLIKSEQRYRTLFEESRDGLYSVSRDGEITDVNPSLCEIFSYATRQELIGKNLRELYRDPADRLRFQEAIEKKGFVKDYEIGFRKKDGTEVDCLITASVQFGDDGSIVGYRGIMRDLTIRKQLQKQLFQAQKMEAIGAFAGGIVHDFNNLLQIVLGYSDMLIMQKGQNSSDSSNLQKIRKAAQDGGYLVKGLLTFSRQAPRETRPVDLNQHLKHVKSILERMIPRMIEIKLVVADDVIAVDADPIQLEQVLMNLAINAHHAMPRGGKLTIEARNITLDEDHCRASVEAKPGEHVMLKVSDTGHGMEKEVLEHIFEPFFTTKQPDVGTGLGLSIVYGIVKNHDGHVTCASKPGQGTTFSIYLPAGPREFTPDVATKSDEMTAPGDETILLVDDDEGVRNLLEQILTQRGYSVFTAENGNKAVAIYREKQNELDLVVLDLNMPGMDGTEALEAIRRIDPKAKILIATGYLANKSTEGLLELGAKGLIDKPFQAKDLLRAIRQVLDETGSRRNPVTGSGPFPTLSAEGEESPVTATLCLDEASGAHEAPDIGEQLCRLRILAIDDREPYLRMLEAGLTQFGQEPVTASSGVEGLQVFQRTPVDLVVCDLGMPELDGWAVAKGIKKICREKEVPKTPFILLTGQSDMEGIEQEARENIADCGVDAIVGKPVDIPELLEIMKSVMKKSQDSHEE